MRWFQQVADGITLTEIGDLEMVSQPGISRALTRLEKEVGTALLRRSGRVLRLTRAGAVFKSHVDAMMHSLDDGFAAVEQLLDPEHGVVTTAFEADLGTWLVPDLIGSFGQVHPGVQFDLRAKATETETSVGVDTDVDLELSTLPASLRDVEALVLCVEPLRLLVHHGQRLAGSSSSSLVAAAGEPFIMPRAHSRLRTVTEELCNRAGFDPRVALVADDLATVRGYVAAGLGVAVVPTLWDNTAEPSTGRIRYVALTDEGATRTLWLRWSTSRRMLASAELFRAHVTRRAKAGKLPSPLPAR